MKISKKIYHEKNFLTLLGNAYTFNLKNHQVLKLKCPSRKDWQSIYSRVWQKGPPLVLKGLIPSKRFLS